MKRQIYVAKSFAAWALVMVAMGTSALLAQNEHSWFKAKDPGPRPNPATAIPVPVKKSTPAQPP